MAAEREPQFTEEQIAAWRAEVKSLRAELFGELVFDQFGRREKYAWVDPDYPPVQARPSVVELMTRAAMRDMQVESGVSLGEEDDEDFPLGPLDGEDDDDDE